MQHLRHGRHLFKVLAVLLLAAVLSPVEIIRAAVELTEKTDHLRQQYALTQENIQRSGGKTVRKTYEVTFQDGRPYRKLIRRDGQPVDAKPEAYATSEERRLELLRELPKAMDYTLEGEETMDGYDCWVLFAKPKPGYKPPSFHTLFLTQMEARVWISKKHSRMVRLDAQTVGPVSFGGFLAKLGPGTRIELQQVRVAEQVWLPSRFKMTYNGRVLFKSLSGEIEQLSSNFRKVSPST
jgi:hypothetical protein